MRLLLKKLPRGLFKVAVIFLIPYFLSFFQQAVAATTAVDEFLNLQQRHDVAGTKKNLYIDQGFFSGGNKAIKKVSLLNVRRSVSPKFERIVLDFKTAEDGLPYFEVRLDPENARYLVYIWASVDFSGQFLKDPKAIAVSKSLAQSKSIKKMNVISDVQPEVEILEFQLKKSAKLEVFYLTQPSRIILDLL